MKIIKSIAATGQLLWVLTPDANITSIRKRKVPLTHLDIFYTFAQQLVKSKEDKEWSEGVKCTMIDLNNRITGLNYIVKKIKRKESKILKLGNNKKNIYDYKPFQEFLVLVETYLNCLHSIRDLIKNIDHHLGKKYYEDIMQEDWFRLNMDLRTLCHHIETPLMTVENGIITFRFERSDRINTIRFLTDSMKDAHGFIHCRLNCSDLGIGIEKFLNKWAKRHLENIDKDKAINQIKRIKKDGTHKLQRTTLGELMIIAESSIQRISDQQIQPTTFGQG
jgi:hypothetical protein